MKNRMAMYEIYINKCFYFVCYKTVFFSRKKFYYFLLSFFFRIF